MAALFPFDVTFYDSVYLSISSELRAKFPQADDEDVMIWHKRLLHEFISYLQSKYEAEEVTIKVNANKKNNKKKTDPEPPNFQPTTLANSLTHVTLPTNKCLRMCCKPCQSVVFALFMILMKKQLILHCLPICLKKAMLHCRF